MRVAIAAVLQESNTFSPVYTKYEDFNPVFGEAALERHTAKLTEMGGFISALSAAKATIVPVCAAWAITANRMLRPDFERLVSDFQRHLVSREIDGLLLAMHGAQTADGLDDVEGYLLARAREVLGPNKPIIVTLDLHANITSAMVRHADAIIGYRTYPHIDMFETGEKAAHLIIRILRGEVRPAMAYRKLPLIIPPENSTTDRGTMRELVCAADAMERDGATLAVSLFPVQPWLDIDEMGCAVVAVTDGNQTLAQQHADHLARGFWDERQKFDVMLTPVPEAIEGALEVEGGPVVFAESSDSTGSGSPGDSTGVLRFLLEASLGGTAAIFLVDPETVKVAFEAGVGGTFEREIGARFDTVYSRPVPVRAYVKLLSDGRWIARGRGYNTGITTSMGRAAVLQSGQVLILVAERSAMTVDPELFRSHGIDPASCKIVVVKSPAGFRSEYEPIAKKIYIVDTPGVSTARLRDLPFQRISRPMYPFDPETPPPENL